MDEDLESHVGQQRDDTEVAAKRVTAEQYLVPVFQEQKRETPQPEADTLLETRWQGAEVHDTQKR